MEKVLNCNRKAEEGGGGGGGWGASFCKHGNEAQSFDLGQLPHSLFPYLGQLPHSLFPSLSPLALPLSFSLPTAFVVAPKIVNACIYNLW